MKMHNRSVLLLILLFASTHFSGPLSGKLIIFHAGSLAVPFKEIAAAFEKEYPDITVIREAAGSRTCARKIADLNRYCDIMASADYTVIDELLIPQHASWNIKFASNEMAIVYHDKSRKSKEISEANWYEVLLEDSIAFGRSDPDSDPCGYRAVLTIKLAEHYYG
ncbi:MAG: tungstate ABC transporter substrate-binding protein WtpA, partial [Chitinivibrionales bacterium]|nr:tungstate ABC transporter substrate-binding protein WtpA [Chitinivibrionales bacterium]